MDNKCTSFTKKGTQCTRVAIHGNKCKTHKDDLDLVPLIDYPFKGTCVTITWCDRAENHAGMEIIGKTRKDVGDAMTPKYLRELSGRLTKEGYECETIKLSNMKSKYDLEEASILVVRKWCIEPSDTLEELTSLTWDKKAKMRGKVVNKTARYNLCFSERSSKANYEEGKGTVVAFRRVPCMSSLRERVNSLLPKDDVDLVAEGNLYYNLYKCYIGYHGDRERDFVIGTRFGDSFCLKYQASAQR